MTTMAKTPAPPASGLLICFSHLRWDFVLQRPQHLMSRFARSRPVLVWEEPVETAHARPFLDVHPDLVHGTSVVALRPAIPRGTPPAEAEAMQARLLAGQLAMIGAQRPLLWLYTPMMWPLAATVADRAEAVVYDCMDELSAFALAPSGMIAREAALLGAADLVFTGGFSIWEAKRGRHDNIHPFPSAVDARHFARAREGLADPPDQAGLPRPRLGFFGVIDERLDLGLIDRLAAARPGWHIVMLGPVAKIAPASLPRRPNLHWLGPKAYADLPAYLSGWDAALMPFAINEATRFISPTKTPEYLAGGVPVVATPVRDVLRHYGGLRGLRVADGPEAFLAACDEVLALRPEEWRPEADRMLAAMSWDMTQRRMERLVAEAAQARRAVQAGTFLAAGAPAASQATLAAPSLRRRARAYDVLVVGAGFAGSVMAERLAEVSGQRVLVIDRRPHVAGNAYDRLDAAGILVHQYGPHIFHTNSDQVAAYLSRFTGWRPYEHRVLARVEGKLLPIPINRTTLNGLYGLELRTEEEAQAFLAAHAEPVADIRTSKDVVVNAVGTHLYRTFFEGYTRKQWGLDPSELDKSVTSRVPTRVSTDDRYFLDTFQAMPAQGFTAMFERMLDHPRIDVELGVDWADTKAEGLAPLTVYTGPIDGFFGHRFGRLPYRSLEFRHETLARRRFQEVAVVNYPSPDVPWTRITEYKHLTGQVHPKTSITYEFPRGDGDPYYPIPRPENQALFKRYEALAAKQRDVVFLGRLGSYRYYNMDQVVGQALTMHRRLAERMGWAEVAPAAQPRRAAATAAR